MRKLLLILALLVPSCLWAQSTTVSGNVIDTDAQAWFNGSVVASFVPAPGTNLGQYTWTGGAFNPGLSITTTIASNGSYSFSIPSNTAIVPSLSKWTFTVNSGTTSLNTQSQTVTVTGGTQTINFTPSGIRISAGPGAIAYLDLEVTAGVGQGYFQLNSTPASSTNRVCQVVTAGICTTWANAGGGSSSPSPGVFNSNFDPPLFQNYTLTTTGAQAGINLTANPIDTHTISWRLAPGTLNTVTDAFPYANGDLHTANAAWVYQSGTFNVNSNVAYISSASISFTYRSDGPTGVANESAQGTMVETAGAATQNGGPCVRMSTVAQTAYCVQAATDQLKLVLYNAGAQTVLGTFNGSAPVTGDVLKITATGTTISLFKNAALIGSATDATIASGSVGMWGVGNVNSNGISNFQGGGFPNCNVQIDSSPDGVTWTSSGAISSQACGTVPNGEATASGVFNFVRVNVTALSAGQTITLVYSGRLAGVATVAGTAPVSNGQWVPAGTVLWVQHTTQGIGAVSIVQGVQILQPNGVVNNFSWSVASGNCNLSSSGGFGVGYVVPVGGWLQSFTGFLNTGGFPQGADYINLYALAAYPTGGSQTTCSGGTITPTTLGMLLASGSVGSFYPVSFVGTSSIPMSPWSIPGFTTTSAVGSPAAGLDWSFTPSTTARTCIQNVSFTLVTSAAAANRIPTLVLTLNGSKVVYAATTAQAASLTQIYSFSPGAAAETVTTGTTVYHIVPFNNGSPVCFNSGLSPATISTLTTAIQAADQYSAISILTQVQQDNN